VSNTRVEKVELTFEHLREKVFTKVCKSFWGPTSKELISWRPSTWYPQHVPIHHVIPKVELKGEEKRNINGS